MKKIFTTLSVMVLLIMIAASCDYDDNTLKENSIIDNNKIVSVKIHPATVKPGEKVDLQLLVAGKTLDQTLEYPVSWQIGSYTINGVYSVNKGVSFKVPELDEDEANDDDSMLVTDDLSTFLSSADYAHFEQNGYVDVVATVHFDTLKASKSFRIASNEQYTSVKYENPTITGINYSAGTLSGSLKHGESFSLNGTLPTSIEFTANTDGSPDKIKWHITDDPDSGVSMTKIGGSFNGESITFTPLNGVYHLMLTISNDNGGSDFLSSFIYFNSQDIEEEDEEVIPDEEVDEEMDEEVEDSDTLIY